MNRTCVPVCIALLLCGVAAQADDSAPLPSAAAASGRVQFVTPGKAGPKRRVGGHSRGEQSALGVAVLAPEQAGLTLREQPTLYWFNAKATPVRIELTLIEAHGVAPLLELKLDGTQLAGIHRFSLQGTAVHLKPDLDYEWSVAAIPNPEERSHDVLSTGAIRRVAGSASLEQQLRDAGAAQKAQLLARSGIWYDALDELSTQLEASPQDHELVTRRADLLEQVGLKDAAAFERR